MASSLSGRFRPSTTLPIPAPLAQGANEYGNTANR